MAIFPITLTLDPMIHKNYVVELIFVVFGFVASMFSFLPEVRNAVNRELLQDATHIANGEILSNDTLRSACIVGSILGSTILILVFPSKEENNRKLLRIMASKFLASILLGLSITPMMIRANDGWMLKNFGLPIDFDTIIFFSVMVSFFGIGVIQVAHEKFPTAFVSRVMEFIRFKSNDQTKETP